MKSIITCETRHRANTSTLWHFVFVLCCYSNETRAPIANLPNSAQLGAPLAIPPSYIRARAVACTCGSGQTDRHRCAWSLYILRCLWLTRNVMMNSSWDRLRNIQLWWTSFDYGFHQSMEYIVVGHKIKCDTIILNTYTPFNHQFANETELHCWHIFLLHIWTPSWDRLKCFTSSSTSCQHVFFGCLLCLIPSTQIAAQCIIQSALSSHSTCPKHHNQSLQINKLTLL